MRHWSAWLLVVALAATLLPLLTLLPLGAFWLWQQGLLLWWLLAAASLGLVTYIVAWVMTRRVTAEQGEVVVPDGPGTPPDAHWTGRDRKAWEKVQALAARSDPMSVTDRGLMLELGLESLETVAAHYHPEEKEPLWRFTLPELLLLSERVSARLRRVMLQTVPGVHLVRVGQLRQLWALKPAARRGLRVFRVFSGAWRAARLVNPAAAILAEARDHLLGAALDRSGAELRRRAVRLWIEEIGRAAIEIYSGRLHLDAGELPQGADAGLGPQAAAHGGPLRWLIVGQANAGKSSLANLLLGEAVATVDALPVQAGFLTWQLRAAGLPEAELTEAPALSATSEEAVVDAATRADFVLWVLAAHRADRAADRRALDRFRAHFAAHPERLMPPVVGVLSQVDRLSPARSWSPPYDLKRPADLKAEAIRDALQAAAAATGLPAGDLVPARLFPASEAYNLDVLLALLASRMDEAGRSRALRVLHAAKGPGWRAVLGQAIGAGRLLLRD